MFWLAYLIETGSPVLPGTNLPIAFGSDDAGAADEELLANVGDTSLGVALLRGLDGPPPASEEVISSRVIDGALVRFADLPAETRSQVAARLAETASRQQVRARLDGSDAAMARVVEDLLAVLEAKGLVVESDLPAAARQKLADRRVWRASLG